MVTKSCSFLYRIIIIVSCVCSIICGMRTFYVRIFSSTPYLSKDHFSCVSIKKTCNGFQNEPDIFFFIMTTKKECYFYLPVASNTLHNEFSRARITTNLPLKLSQLWSNMQGRRNRLRATGAMQNKRAF